ncbi:imm11 family protein [Roseibium sediminis]|uniref:imm11 family protein n=1 Tax=Roseibium sediminis TaxID=1775174 RepID=UPI00123D7A26|nr:DUF1629 domain-containing protein [Roseibium sediminis]
MAVYGIFYDRIGDPTLGEETFADEVLDGDFKSAFPVGVEFDPSVKAAFASDGGLIQQDAQYQGLPVDMSGLPKRVRLGGAHKFPLPDLLKATGHFLVSEKLRDAIEVLEPDVHQFQPVELIWQDGSPVATYFWFNVCNRRDAMDREHTTYSFNDRIKIWNLASNGKFVVNTSQSNGAHVWVDSRLTNRTIFVSESFKDAMTAAGITGIGYSEYQTV